MMTWTETRAEEIRLRAGADDEGRALFVLLLDDDHEPIVAAALDDAADHLLRDDDAAAVLTRFVEALVDQTGAVAVLLALVRPEARALPVECELWHDLRELLDPSIDLVDLLVVGPDDYWSAEERLMPRAAG